MRAVSTSSRKPSVNRTPALWALTIIVSLGLAGCAAEPAQMPELRLVETFIVGSQEGANQRKFPAELRGVQRAVLGFETPGTVSAINVGLGDRFSKGQVLARLDPAQQRLTVTASRASVREAEAFLREARLDYERKAALAGTGAVSGAVIDAAQSRLAAARAQHAAAQANVSLAQESLGDTALRAPYSGEVTQRLVEPFQTVAAGQALIEIVGGSAGLEAVVQVPAPLRERFSTGASAEFSVSGSDTIYSARVTKVASGASANGLYEVALRVPAAGADGLKSGQQGDIVLSLPIEPSAQTIPLGSWFGASDGTAQVMIERDQ